MAICPKCSKKIGYLSFSANVVTFGSFDLNSFPEHSNDGYGEWENTEYTCPECDEEIFRTEDEARKFLE